MEASTEESEPSKIIVIGRVGAACLVQRTR